ncbi:MAG: porin, partial [Gammaproteobacteria bacterium]|nr:porin [Gammaproteobacteria bacterium]
MSDSDDFQNVGNVFSLFFVHNGATHPYWCKIIAQTESLPPHLLFFVAQKQQLHKKFNKNAKKCCTVTKNCCSIAIVVETDISSDSKNVGIYKGTPMNKNILAIAIAAAVAAPSAFAAATVYGKAHMSVDSVNNAQDGTKNGSATNVASNSSHIGIKGSESLGAGLKAVYKFET